MDVAVRDLPNFDDERSHGQLRLLVEEAGDLVCVHHRGQPIGCSVEKVCPTSIRWPSGSRM